MQRVSRVSCVREQYRYSQRMFKKLQKLAVKCSNGDEISCRKYNEIVTNLETPFPLFRGVDRYGALKNLREGRITAGKVRDEMCYFTLDFNYAIGYAGPEGIVYMIKVIRSLLKLLKPIKYSTKSRYEGITKPDIEYYSHTLAKEMAFVAEEGVPLDPRYVIILYPVLPTIPPKPASNSVIEIVEEFKKKGFRVYPFYYG